MMTAPATAETLSNRVAELLARQADAPARRERLVVLAASGDKRAAKDLEFEVETESRLQIEIADTRRALESLEASEETQRRIEAVKLAQSHAAQALAACQESEALAAKAEAAIRELGTLLVRWHGHRQTAAQSADAAMNAMSQAGVPYAVVPVRQQFSETAFAEFVRDARLRAVFPPRVFEAMCRAGSPLIDWLAPSRGVLAAESAAMTQELNAALAGVLPEGKSS